MNKLKKWELTCKQKHRPHETHIIRYKNKRTEIRLRKHYSRSAEKEKYLFSFLKNYHFLSHDFLLESRFLCFNYRVRAQILKWCHFFCLFSHAKLGQFGTRKCYFRNFILIWQKDKKNLKPHSLACMIEICVEFWFIPKQCTHCYYRWQFSDSRIVDGVLIMRTAHTKGRQQ